MKYIVAVDGSPESKRALGFAVDLAKNTGADIEVVHSITPSLFSDRDGVKVEDMSEAEERAMEIIRESVEEANNSGVEAMSKKLYGEPADNLSSLTGATEEVCLFVGVCGSQTNGKPEIGDVTRDLVRKSNVPVTVVH